MSVGEVPIPTLTGADNEAAWPLYRLSVDQVRRMCEEGILDEEQPVELLDGILIDRDSGQGPGMSSSEIHRFLVQKIRELFRSLVRPGIAHVVSEDDAHLSESSLLQPDICIVKGKLEDFEDRYPNADDIPLCLEVAQTSLQRDRGAKAVVYASAGIDVYIIINLVAESVEVYTNPNMATAEYRNRQTFGRGDVVVIDMNEVGAFEFDAAECLPTKRNK